jgi:hypothetical protein
MAHEPQSASATTSPATATAVPGGAILIRLRRLIAVSILAALVYSLLTTGSKGYCPGTGEAADSCVNMALRPSPVVYIALAILVFAAIGAVLRRAATEASAIRLIDRAATAAIGIAGVCALVSIVWFALIPIESWNGGGTFFFPFPFGSVEMTVTPAN